MDGIIGVHAGHVIVTTTHIVYSGTIERLIQCFGSIDLVADTYTSAFPGDQVNSPFSVVSSVNEETIADYLPLHNSISIWFPQIQSLFITSSFRGIYPVGMHEYGLIVRQYFSSDAQPMFEQVYRPPYMWDLIPARHHII